CRRISGPGRKLAAGSIVAVRGGCDDSGVLMERALSVPSKLFLSGEYAVLWGGTARIAAVGPRAHAYVRSRDDREVRLLLEAGGLRGYATALGVNWQSEISPAFLFAARTVDLALRAHGGETLGFDLALSPSPPVG